jgi:hypothetical protein
MAAILSLVHVKPPHGAREMYFVHCQTQVETSCLLYSTQLHAG